MTKFNVGSVGDKVRILDGQALIGNHRYKVTTGKEYEILSFHERTETSVEHIKISDNHSNPFSICDYEYKYIKLVEKKLTKDQRITALENEVAELRPLKQEVAELKLIVHELRDGRKTMRDVMNEVLSEPSTTNAVEDKPLTPNQQRAAIIEKAKKFVDEHKSKYRSEWNIVGHTVQILIYDSNGMLMMFRQAKCNPNDVFNEHIGKAIALGRALGLDVSEFEQAVQPNEVVMGMNLEVRTNGEVDFNHKPVDADDLIQCNHDFHKEDSGVFIINDTNAKYEEGQ